MRTTLDIEDDVLDAARELARRDRISAGAAVSKLLRAALTGHANAGAAQPEAAASNGFRTIPAPTASSTACATKPASDARAARRQCPDRAARRRPRPPPRRAPVARPPRRRLGHLPDHRQRLPARPFPTGLSRCLAGRRHRRAAH